MKKPMIPKAVHQKMRRPKSERPDVTQLKEIGTAADSEKPLPQSAVSPEVKAALDRCAEAAEDGFQKAEGYLKRSKEVIEQAGTLINNIAKKHDKNKANAPLLADLKQVIVDLESTHAEIDNIVREKRRKLKSFNITLFGRTMVGKSTLMEVLTHGSGESIGSGAQRTTRDVRSYLWQGLTVTDVPGVAAFGGEADEEIAFNAAKQADLILFLISDDAPQPSEAKRLGRLRKWGIPILGIVNVKWGLEGEIAIKHFIHKQDKIFDDERLRGLFAQFNELADKHTPGRELPFIPTHLNARFLASRCENSALTSELAAASRFSHVEESILNEIITNGPFLRMRSFLHGATESTLETSEALLQVSTLLEEMHLRLVDRKGELDSWRNSFQLQARQRLKQTQQETIGKLRNEIRPFAAAHWHRENANKDWEARIESEQIETKFRILQENLVSDCLTRLQEVEADTRAEIDLMAITIQAAVIEAKRFGAHGQSRKWLRENIGDALLAIVAVLLIGGGIGSVAVLVATVVGSFLGRLYQHHMRTKKEAIAEMTEQMQSQLDAIQESVAETFDKWFTQQIIAEVVERFIQSISDLAQTSTDAAAVCRETAWSQNDVLLDLNRQNIEDALRHIGLDFAVPTILKVARIPGQAIVMATAGKRQLPDAAITALEAQFNESVKQLSGTLHPPSIIQEVVGGYQLNGSIDFDETRHTARLTWKVQDSEARVRMQLARQLAGFHIVSKV
ncbi:MAG: GTPase domain-containing protein [Caldilineaceae bacterium SB0664_bin_27]|uniref:GTPase domain-containing protein n=1 Tax=Caldilineaceae bacterium SB0664_bin_27 TaxID=2605260 RepID=A0A6B0YMG1_9CHLR|nr:GTPase domain-containing protein [Caldilineaceae bacterium SB0664_bin_27]